MRIQRGGQGDRTPTQKSQKYRGSKQYWSESPVKPQGLQASIQCWATIGPPVKRHFKWRFTGGPMMADLLW